MKKLNFVKTIFKSAILYTVLVQFVYSAENEMYCKDSLYDALLSKPVSEMTDYEYRHFEDYHDDCEQYDGCNDFHLKLIIGKKIKDMNQNEFDYFEDMLFECDTLNPCLSNHYLNLRNDTVIKLTNNELEFFEECDDECGDYIEKICGKRRRGISLAFAGVAFAFITLGLTEYITASLNEHSCTSSKEMGIVYLVPGTILFSISVPIMVSGIKLKRKSKCKEFRNKFIKYE